MSYDDEELEEKDIKEGSEDLDGFLEDDENAVDDDLENFSDEDLNPNEEDEYDGMPEGFADLDGSEY